MSVATQTGLVRVLDLAGTDVVGMRAQVRRRYDWPDWEPMWRTLTSVEVRKIRGEEWVYMRWEKNGAHDCGFSGRVMSLAVDWVIEVAIEESC